MFTITDYVTVLVLVLLLLFVCSPLSCGVKVIAAHCATEVRGGGGIM